MASTWNTRIRRLLGRKQLAAPRHVVTLLPSGRQLEVAENQTVLEVALGEGLPFPHNCRAGICHACRCELLQGEVYLRREASRMLSPTEPDEPNIILACQSEPRSALVLQVDSRGNRPIPS